MAENNPADDVAEDYRQALEDLTLNSRIEIATLTNIAKENAEHGLAIVEVLTSHIKKVPPNRTLPALYVLDSIVKNVPTPYALYFGPKLYSIFMGAYAKVDNATRAKMHEMLKTWKEPVPGSISKKPVFPIEQVRPIENALIAAKNAAMAAHQSSFQGQHQLMRGRQPVAPTRNTPTPPTGRAYQPPAHGQYQHQDAFPMRPSNGHKQGISIDQLKHDIQQLIVADKAEFAQDPLDTSKQTRLKALLDLQDIIQKQGQTMPQDQLMIIRDRIAELAAVNLRAQRQQQQQQPPPVSAPSAAFPAPHTTYNQPPYTHTPTPPAVSQQPPPVPQLPPAIAALLGRAPQAAQAPAPPPPPAVSGVGVPPGTAAGNISLDSILGKGALATLLSGIAQKSATPTPTPPQVSTPQFPPVVIPPAAAAAIAALRSPSQQTPFQPPPPVPVSMPVSVPAPAPAPPAAAAPPPADASGILAMLRQRGLIGSNAPTPTPPPRFPFPFPIPGTTIPPPPPPGFMNNNNTAPIQLTPASLKVYRKHLITSHLDDLGPQCTQCGRRFRTDEEGRRRKTAHMDWHFKVHQRMSKAERLGHQRSLLVDEPEWIMASSQGQVDVDGGDAAAPLPFVGGGSDGSGGFGGGGGGGGKENRDLRQQQQKQQKQQQQHYIPVPEDTMWVSSTCSICQDKFEMRWLDEAQEWVWMDAMRVGGNGGKNGGGKVYHASCYAEVYGHGASSGGNKSGGAGGAGGGGYRQTPERVLGKRKAEDEGHGFRGKMKMEGY